jgi:hypothetical protein
MTHVRMSVAMVMPEIGFDELPIKPTMREETVTKKKPKTTMSREAKTFPCSGILGSTSRASASSTVPTSTTIIGMSRSVRVCCVEPPPRRSFMLAPNDVTMVGSVRPSVIKPAASTAPAPMYLMYAVQICPGLIWEIRYGAPVAGLWARVG